MTLEISNWRRVHGPGQLIGTFSVAINELQIAGMEIYRRGDGEEWVRFPDSAQRQILAALNAHLGLQR